MGGASWGGVNEINFGNVKCEISIRHQRRDSKLYISQEFTGKFWARDKIWELTANKWCLALGDWMSSQRD